MGFSDRLKELRIKKGLSQDALAEALEIPRTTISHYEKNKDDRLPRKDRLNKIADFFGVSVDYLIGRAKTPDLNKAEKAFLEDVENVEKDLTVEDLMKKHNLIVDGKPASKEEIEGAIAFIRSLRSLK
ncbi:helix-turn-helix domain-containing protein [Neobacillus sedimentimangrovi]|jgi:transcriptional regulator with XRE-family HTH domain|uniref:Helix-turn-helix domain-containing protein n=1 Tax=Neobacillus sedimentimangrovi TaxID=2699460 RepID=A0ABS8QFW0_9BACI|nr:helix-turn-helix transcriptional regulator [Neobacillus sedimentimangrovi]MCD4838134.1 helix-turn-helix domain-containing protein [Neobacillus sedimentimangrovi]